MAKPETVMTIPDDFWEKCDIRQIPKLPKIKYKANGFEIEAVDLRTIRDDAYFLFLACVNHAVLYNAEQVVIDASKYYDDIDALHLITSIAMSAGEYEFKKRKFGRFGGHFLIGGTHCRSNVEEKTVTLTVDLLKDHAKFIYDYGQRHPERPLDYYSMLASYAEEELTEWNGFLIKEAKKEADNA